MTVLCHHADMSFWSEVWSEIGVTGPQAVSVIIASVVMYFALAVLLQILGQRLYANKSAAGLAVVLVMGSVTARTMLGPGPTMTAGLICLVTLVLCEWIFDFIEFAPRRPTVVWRDGGPDRPALRRFHIHVEQLRGALRKAKVADVTVIDVVLLEPDGTFTIVYKDQPLDPQLVKRVQLIE